MRTNKIIVVLVSITLILGLQLISSCGGGGGGGAPAPVPGVANGQIQAFGSVIVNEVEFETTSPQVTIEDKPGSINDLREGMVIKIKGTFNSGAPTGKADIIKFNDDVVGPMTAATETLPGIVKSSTIMGQTVILEDGVTHFDAADPTFNFAAVGAGTTGNVVEVSGHPRPDGSIQATFVRRKAADVAAHTAAGNLLEVRGHVQTLAGNTFKINNVTVDFAGVTPRNGTVQDGTLVEVKGSALDPATNTLVATDVAVEAEGLQEQEIEKAEVEGFVTGLNAANKNLRVKGQAIDFSKANFPGGFENELIDGVEVEAEGPIIGGNLVADRIAFKEGVKFEANVATIDAAAGTMTFQALPGITVRNDVGITRLDVTLNSVVAGNHMKIRGRLSSSAGGVLIVATRIEKLSENPNNRIIMQGTVNGVAAPNVTVMGINVDTTAIPDVEFKGEEDVVIGRAGFFGQLGVGALVKARADLNVNTNALTWNQVEFED